MKRDVETCCRDPRPTTKTELESLLREDYYRALEPVFPDKTLEALIKEEKIRAFQKCLIEELGIEFVIKDPIKIPEVDSARVLSVFGNKAKEAEDKLKTISDYVSLRNSKYGQAFFQEEPEIFEVKTDKSAWAKPKRKKFGEDIFEQIFEKTQYRANIMFEVHLSAQMMLIYLKNTSDHSEVIEAIRQIDFGIMERIKGSADGSRNPYDKLDKQGKLEVVEFIETTCLDVLRFFSGEINTEDLAKPILDGSALSA